MSTKPVTHTNDLVISTADMEGVLALTLAEKVPVTFISAPGVGKTSIIGDFARKNNLQLIDWVRLSQMTEVDLRGLADFDRETRTTTWYVPDWMPRDMDSQGILFLDEITSAQPNVQAGAYQLFCERRLGEYRLPAGWHIVAAGNRATDRGVVVPMASPLKNRMAIYHVVSNAEHWLQWAVRNGVHHHITSFIKHRPEMLNEFDRKDVSVDHTKMSFYTQRSWDKLSRLYVRNLESQVLPVVTLASGLVGRAAASEWAIYMEVYSVLPTIEEIVANPTTTRLPAKTELSQLYATASMLAGHFNAKNAEALYTYATRLPREFTVACIKEAFLRWPGLASTKAFAAFSKDFSSLIVAAMN